MWLATRLLAIQEQRDALAAKNLHDEIAKIIDSGDLESILFASEAPFSEQYRMAFYKFRHLRAGKDGE
ncbi:hypothetical protein [Pantoea agglomerans]|uniref:hypothetical protein n=1 Tax=Enterobacter agglomerans TaxID=549 RepID=UPI00320A5125